MRRLYIDRALLKRMYVYKRYNQYKIGRRFNCSQWVISDRLRSFGIKTRPKTYNLIRRRYSYNKNFLKNMSANNAWVLGLLVSDGFVRRNNKSGYFGLKMKLADRDVILKAKNILEYNGPIFTGKSILEYKNCIKEFRYSLLQINGIKTVEELERIGIKQNKTHTEKFLACIKETNSQEIISSFIRGVYDGDGSFLFDKKRNSACFQIVGTRQLLLAIQNYLMCYCHLNRTKLTQNILGSNHFALRYRGNQQSIKTLGWIYKYSNTFNRMDRKFNKFCQIKRAISI